MHQHGIKTRPKGRRIQGIGFASALGRRGFFTLGSHDPTPATDNIITDAGINLITADGEQIVRRR